MAQVDAGPGCWNWRAGRDDKGYGRFFVAKRPASLKAMKAHRLALLLLGVDIPDGREIAHECDNPACVRPDHLSLATHSENMRQMAARGRGASLRDPAGRFRLIGGGGRGRKNPAGPDFVDRLRDEAAARAAARASLKDLRKHVRRARQALEDVLDMFAPPVRRAVAS